MKLLFSSEHATILLLGRITINTKYHIGTFDMQ